MKKKVCILSNGIKQGGTDTFVINLVNGLDKTNYDITVVISATSPELLTKEKELISAGANVIHTNNLRGFSGRLKHLISLFKILKKGGYDVFQCNIDLFNGPNLAIAKIAGVPIRICHSHNSSQGREKREGKTISVRIYQEIMKWMCWHFSNRRCGCSSQAMDFIYGEKWQNDSNSFIIKNGIDLEKFRGIKKSEGGINSEVISPDRYHVLTVGAMVTQKNPFFIIDIFKELLLIRSDIDLIWVGDGVLKEHVYKKVSDLKLNKQIIFLGIRDDIPELMYLSDVFLLPSLFEGLGIVLVEAQAADLPCIISENLPLEVDCGGCIRQNLDSPAVDWASTINNVLNGRISFRTNRSFIQEYSIENMVHQMEQVFR